MNQDNIKPLDSSVLNTIINRSEAGKSIAKVIRGLGLPLMETLASLQRFHNDDVLAAKAKQRAE